VLVCRERYRRWRAAEANRAILAPSRLWGMWVFFVTHPASPDLLSPPISDSIARSVDCNRMSCETLHPRDFGRERSTAV